MGYEVGDLVWAKMKGFPPWPAKIAEPNFLAKIPKSKKAHQFVVFFGTNDFAWIPDENISPHTESVFDSLIKKKTKNYQHAIDELMDYIKKQTSPKVKGKVENGKKSTKVVKIVETAPKKRERHVLAQKSPLKKVSKKRHADIVNGKSNAKKRRTKSNSVEIQSLESSPTSSRHSDFNDDHQLEDANDSDSEAFDRKVGFIGLNDLGLAILEKISKSGIKNVVLLEDDLKMYNEKKEKIENVKVEDTPMIDWAFKNVLLQEDIRKCEEEKEEMEEAIKKWEEEKEKMEEDIKKCEEIKKKMEEDTNFLDEEEKKKIGEDIKENEGEEKIEEVNVADTPGANVINDCDITNVLGEEDIKKYKKKIKKLDENINKYKKKKKKIEEVVTVVNTPADVIIDCDITFCSYESGTDFFNNIIFGENGILKGFEEAEKLRQTNKGYVGLTSIDYETSKKIHDAISVSNGFYLEAPVIGPSYNSSEGKFVIFASGNRKLFIACKEYFKLVSKNSLFVSCEIGVSSNMSVILNALSGTVLAAMAETAVLYDRLCVYQSDMLEFMRLMLENDDIVHKAERMNNRSNRFPITPLRHVQKDMSLSLNVADSENQRMHITSTANEVYKRARLMSYSDSDVTAVYKIIKY